MVGTHFFLMLCASADMSTSANSTCMMENKSRAILSLGEGIIVPQMGLVVKVSSASGYSPAVYL